jgi:hypothetical protein
VFVSYILYSRNLPNILTAAAIGARCHAGDKAEGRQLVVSGIVGVEMSALRAVWTFGPKEMDVT